MNKISSELLEGLEDEISILGELYNNLPEKTISRTTFLFRKDKLESLFQICNKSSYNRIDSKMLQALENQIATLNVLIITLNDDLLLRANYKERIDKLEKLYEICKAYLDSPMCIDLDSKISKDIFEKELSQMLSVKAVKLNLYSTTKNVLRNEDIYRHTWREFYEIYYHKPQKLNHITGCGNAMIKIIISVLDSLEIPNLVKQ